MGRLQRRDDAFEFGADLEHFQRFGIGGRDIFGALHVVQEGVFRADAGIVEACGDGVGVDDLAVIILQEIGAVAVEYAGAAALDTGDAGIGQASGAFENLLARLAADDRLEIAHHGRIGVRAGHRADDVESVMHIGDPVAQRLIHRILQRAGAGGDGHDLGAKQFHAEDIGRLPRDIGGAHEDGAGQAETGCDRGRGDAMLAGAGLGDDAGLAHAQGEQDLAEAVIDLVAAGMIELVALEPDLGAAEFLGQALGKIHRARLADIIAQEFIHLVGEGRIDLGRLIGGFQLKDERHQGFRDISAAEIAKTAGLVGPGGERIGSGVDGRSLAHGACPSRSGRARGGERIGKGLYACRILDAWRRFNARGHVDSLGAGSGYSPADIGGIKPAGQEPGYR